MIKVHQTQQRDCHTKYKEVFCDWVHNNIDKASFRIIYMPNHYEIWCFGVEPKYRGYGYGQQMLSELIAMFNDMPLELGCLKNNYRALHIYDKFGFTIVKDCGDYYWMRKEVE